MKEGQQIRPEWVPRAYKDGTSLDMGAQIKAKAHGVSLLYSGKKMPLKSRINKGYKKL